MNQLSLANFLDQHHQPSYRFTQVKEAYCRTLSDSWEGVTAWSKKLREEASEQIPWDEFSCERIQESKDGDTIKFLLVAKSDGVKIETVIMRHNDGRNTVCISSQAGCPMACSFCATGMAGFKRNLTASEIFEQVIHAARFLKQERGARSEEREEGVSNALLAPRSSLLAPIPHITNVVFMGMGEPMHNYDAVMESVRMLNDPDGFGLGARHISISTCGIVPGILRLAKEPEQINLAISLHSAIPSTRSKLMPVNQAYPIDKLMKAVERYAFATNRKVLFEYLLIKDVNDSKEEADALADLMLKNKRLYHVNLIKYHDTGAFLSTPKKGREMFLERLEHAGIHATLRYSFGEDIEAACGQLATQDAGLATTNPSFE
ncbi:MAG: 23S rRNA (adenine(2503)-C(2))-methyltransferase RlmN [Patescibacteria group bacterium]